MKKRFFVVTGKTYHTIHIELRKIGNLINPIPNNKYHIKRMMTKATRLLLIKKNL